jgi:3-oxoacyl-[acyl-carrier-protein] synthase III
VNAERLRATDAKAAARKRDESRKFAERRKQREIELATVAVRRMLRDRDRDPQQVADGIETPRETPREAPRFGFFGQD